MDAGVVVALAATLTVLFVAANFSGRGAQLIGGLFSPPGLGWPPGVQEDDDLRWRWTNQGDPPREPDPEAPPPARSVPPTSPQRRVTPTR